MFIRSVVKYYDELVLAIKTLTLDLFALEHCERQTLSPLSTLTHSHCILKLVLGFLMRPACWWIRTMRCWVARLHLIYTSIIKVKLHSNYLKGSTTTSNNFVYINLKLQRAFVYLVNSFQRTNALKSTLSKNICRT